MRSARELRAQLRAVTAEDYENLAKGASRSVARVKCNIPQSSGGRLPPGMIEILVVPAVADSLRTGNLSKLHVDEVLTKTIEDHLDSYRLLTTTLHIREPEYQGIKVEAEIVPSEYSLPETVIARVVDALNNFISPLPVANNLEQQDDLTGFDWEGWPFGRDLYVAEIFSLIQRVPGVKHVLDVQLSKRRVTPAGEHPLDSEEREEADKNLTLVKKKVIRVAADTLLCSLTHQITIAELGGEDAAD